MDRFGGSLHKGSSTNIGTGLKSAIFVPSSGSQTVTSTAVTIPYGMMGNNGEVIMFILKQVEQIILAGI